MQGTNAHMLLGRAGGSGQDQQAAAVAAALPWQSSRFWPSPPAHPLLSSCVLSSSWQASQLLLQADLTTAATACWRAVSLGGSSVLPATVLLELAAGASQLLSEAAPAAVLGSTLTPLLMLEAGQPLLLSCSVDVLSGTAEVHRMQPASQPLLSCSYGLPVLDQAAGTSRQPAPSGMAVQLRCLQQSAAAQRATAILVAPESARSCSTLPFALCEAAATLAAGAGLAGSQAAVRSCAVFVARAAPSHHPLASSPQHLVTARTSCGSVAGLHLVTSCSNSGACTTELCGIELSSMPSHQMPTSSYALEWRRMLADEVDPR